MWNWAVDSSSTANISHWTSINWRSQMAVSKLINQVGIEKVGNTVFFHARVKYMAWLKFSLLVLKSERGSKHLSMSWLPWSSSNIVWPVKMMAVYLFFPVVSSESIIFCAYKVDRQVLDITGHNLIDFLDNQKRIKITGENERQDQLQTSDWLYLLVYTWKKKDI